MGRSRKQYLIEDAKDVANLAAAVREGRFPRADLPAMLADAKALDDKELIAAILGTCSK